MIFYHNRLDDGPTGTTVSLHFLWLMSTVANSVETKVRHKTTPTSTTIIIMLLFKMYALYYTDDYSRKASGDLTRDLTVLSRDFFVFAQFCLAHPLCPFSLNTN